MYIITPTGGRPEQLALLDKYLQRQTNQDFKWIVLDDYQQRSKKPDRCDIHISPDWLWNGENTQAKSMLRLLDEVGTDKVIICEDDDWYAPNHVELFSKLLNDYDLVGQKPTIYYNVKNQTYRNFYKTDHSCMCQTGLKGGAIEHLKQVCLENITNLDVIFWKTWQGSKHLDSTMTAVGIKGLAGRGGIGIGHTMQGEPDPSGEQLQTLIGNDTKYYL